MGKEESKKGGLSELRKKTQDVVKEELIPHCTLWELVLEKYQPICALRICQNLLVFTSSKEVGHDNHLTG